MARNACPLTAASTKLRFTSQDVSFQIKVKAESVRHVLGKGSAFLLGVRGWEG